MAQITKISQPPKSPKKRSVHLDGKWAFNLPGNVVEKFGLKVGQDVSAEEVEKIRSAEVQQKAVDKGLSILSRRLHSRSELQGKLARAKYTSEQIEKALTDLERMGYIDDERFARAKAQSAAAHRKHGQRRAYVELIKAGVDRETARKANETVYDAHDSLKVARELAARKLPSLLKLDRVTARRRLTGMLLRRGFNFDEIKPVLEEVLGHSQTDIASPPRGAPAAEVAVPATEIDDDVPVEEVVEDGAADPVDWRAAMLPAHARKKPKASKWGNRGRSSFHKRSDRPRGDV